MLSEVFLCDEREKYFGMEIRMEKKELLYDFLKEADYRPMKEKELASLFCVPRMERDQFHGALDELVAEGLVFVGEDGRYRLPSEDMGRGTFMATSRGFGFVRMDGRDEDVFVPELYTGSAFDGDTVLVQIFKDVRNTSVVRSEKNKGKRCEGKIVRVLVRAHETLVGTFVKNRHFGFVLPDNTKITSDIYIPKENAMGAVDGDKVVVEIEDFGEGEKKSPTGKVTEILGHKDDPGIDILSVVRAFELPEDFSPAALRFAEKIPSEVTADDIGRRMDYRERVTVTIDGEEAKDLDDAITLCRTEDGGYELGVHIADVCHYVREGTSIDKEALLRGTSVYLADRVIPMIPHKLSNGICSLNQGEDRLTLSCMISYDKDGKIRDTKIDETVICVDQRMSYTDVNAIVTDHDEQTMERYQELVPMFESMKELALILRKNRKKQGSIDFDFPECKIKMDENGRAVEIVPYERNMATKIIEEFMLAANKVVAEEFFWRDIPFLYRTHDYPDMEKMKELAALARNFSHTLKLGPEEVHPGEIQKLIESVSGSEEEIFLERVTLRAMKRARYSTQCDGHFGLATKYYCHFTSPIRRYPDMQIHRIIKQNLRKNMSKMKIRHYEEILPNVANACSDLERRADDAEREVEKMKKAEYMTGRIGEVYEGVVSGVTGWGIYVELPSTVEGMVRLADMTDDRYEYESENYRVVGKRSGKEYRLGQRLRVQVANADTVTHTVDFVIPEEGED